MKHIIGIDPGFSGCIAVMDEAHKVVRVSNMPETPMDILDLLRCYEGGGVVYVLREWDSDGNRLEARLGDWLCEDYDGRWTIQKGNSDEGTDD